MVFMEAAQNQRRPPKNRVRSRQLVFMHDSLMFSVAVGRHCSSMASRNFTASCVFCPSAKHLMNYTNANKKDLLRKNFFELYIML